MAAHPPESPTTQMRLDDFAAYARPMPIRYWFYLAGYLLAALAVAAIGLILAILIGEFVRGFLYTPIVLFELGVFLGIFLKLLRRARRYRLDSQAEILEDPRPPVLLLRTFRSDVAADESRRDKKTAEEFLVEVFTHVGPVVAVGKPDEKLSLLGAARMYFNHDEWQEKVASLISISQLVIIQAGSSDALEWELSRAVSVLRPRQLLVSFVHFKNRQTSYEQFLFKAARVLDGPLPPLIGDTFFWTFKDHWIPVELSPKGRGDFKKKIQSAVEPVIRYDSRSQGFSKQVLGMIFTPWRTFQDIGWKENWFPPLLFSSVISLFTIYVLDPSPNFVRVFTNLFFLPLLYVVLSGVIWIGLMLCRINITIKQIFCILAWSYVPVLVVFSLVLLFRVVVPTYSLEGAFINIALLLAALLPADVDLTVKALALVVISWYVLLLSMGFIVIGGGASRAKRRRIALIITTLLVLLLVVVNF
jgi:hypothetical protein